MKILMVIPYLAPSYGGTAKVVEELAENLGTLDDIQLDVIATNADNGNTLSVRTFQWISETNYRVQYFPTWHRRDLIVSLSLIQWLIQHMREYDLVHTHTVFAPLISLTHGLCRLWRVPYIVTPHGMLEPWALSYKSKKKRLYYDKVEKAALKNASAIQAVASPEADNIKKLGFHHSILVPNGLPQAQYIRLPSPDIFHQKFPHTCGKRLILFLGRIDPKKGLDLLAPAFAQVYATFPETHLILAGPDSIGFTPKVKSYFAQSNCLDAVTFTGMLTGQLKYAALAAASLYVAPSYSEGFSMSVLEGMAAGLPCIITENCNFPEAKVAEAAYVVPANSQAIGAALLAALQNPEQSKQIGTNARQLILQNYTWEQAAQKLAKSYATILQSHLPQAIRT